MRSEFSANRIKVLSIICEQENCLEELRKGDWKSPYRTKSFWKKQMRKKQRRLSSQDYLRSLHEY